MVCYKCKKIGCQFFRTFFIFSGYFSNILSQTIHMKKILIFKVAQMQKWMAPLERAGKTDKKWYGSIWSDENISRYEGLKIHEKWEKCWISKINVVSTLNISRTFNRIISNHSIFRSVFPVLSNGAVHFLHLSNFKK